MSPLPPLTRQLSSTIVPAYAYWYVGYRETFKGAVCAPATGNPPDSSANTNSLTRAEGQKDIRENKKKTLRAGPGEAT